MQYYQFLIIIIFSPLVNGVIRTLKANMQGRQGPGVLQPYYDLARLFKKDMVVSTVTSWIFKATPYIVFVSTIAAAMIVPVVSTRSAYGMMGDVIALIALFALARFFMALAGLDAGTAFGGEEAAGNDRSDPCGADDDARSLHHRHSCRIHEHCTHCRGTGRCLFTFTPACFGCIHRGDDR
jgi:formate hydrogenlyase subunit 4